MKISRVILKKSKPTGYLYLPGSQLRQEERDWEISSCLQYAVVNVSPHIVKYTNKEYLYRKCSTRPVKDMIINEINHAFCVSSIMNITSVLKI